MKNHNDLILERLRGIPARPMTLADKYDPRNPNVKDQPANDNNSELKTASHEGK